MKEISQRTLVRMMEAFSGMVSHEFSRKLYENDFADWFVLQASSHYDYNWDRILPDLRNGRFFFATDSYFAAPTWNITGQYLSDHESKKSGTLLIEKLAALASTLPQGGPVKNSLELDGFSVDAQRLRLIPLEGPVSANAEEDALTSLVNRSSISNATTIVKHMVDASGLYVERKYHPSLNESRNLLQCLIDSISEDTDKSGTHSRGLPGGMKNRVEYLEAVGFLTSDEMAAQNSAWGALSAGSHPGVPARDVARIGLVLALEFGQLLLLKYEDWRKNAFKGFTP